MPNTLVKNTASKEQSAIDNFADNKMLQLAVNLYNVSNDLTFKNSQLQRAWAAVRGPVCIEFDSGVGLPPMQFDPGLSPALLTFVARPSLFRLHRCVSMS
eukprot:10430210-Alexandrium_andersonii.AAC.1